VTLRTTRRLVLSIAALLGIQLVTAFGAIVLLGRMSPAIERIIHENVASVAAVEQMAFVLAEPEIDAAARQRFFEALARAKGNVTESEERPAIETLERLGPSALAGEASARRDAIAALAALGEVNRNAMAEADTDAGRLASAGAWAAVFLGLLGLIASGVTIHRLELRMLVPLAEITRTVVAHRSGDRRRRCATALASGELELVMTTLNELFDYRERVLAVSRPVHAPTDDQALIIELLDDRPEPAVVVDRTGAVLRANRRALELLSDQQRAGLRMALGRAVRGEAVPELREIRQVGQSEQWLCLLSPLPSSGGNAYAARP
jgi:PAS domain-containing protein